ncbi:sugar ABC transporter permease [Kosmotoga arenicorallina S304]|uniref:Sugar ABC transporter permease n=1 Tax=Kosmotoga arenicorallina S304 TaxID=1453497 RepID=A0A176JZH7_9BACT|nr:sugar ABC transporter permease [Kosmotoga arenicorallina]OAA29476.1 sugar ABC transporter permease [Kosmotoga arenicorallina S304]
MRNSQRKLFIMIIPAFVLLILFVYFPIVKGGVVAFQNYNLFDLTNVHFIGLDNFKAVITDRNFNFWRICLNTVLWIFVSLFFQFVLGFGLALLMRKPFKGRGIYSALVFYPWAVSGFAIGLVWAWMFNGQFGMINDLLMRLGIINNNIGFLSDPKFAMMSVIIANVWYGVPFFAIMLLAALQSVPKELYEAAEIDGATKLRQLFDVTIPYIKPTIISTTLLRTMWIMNFPEIIYGMTGGGPANSTNILATLMINKIYKFYDYGQGAAIGFIIMSVLFVYAFFYLRLTSSKEVVL